VRAVVAAGAAVTAAVGAAVRIRKMDGNDLTNINLQIYKVLDDPHKKILSGSHRRLTKKERKKERKRDKDHHHDDDG